MYRKIAAILLVTFFSCSVSAETLLECSKIEDATERVACYDQLAGRVEEKLEEKYEGTTEQRVEARKIDIAEEVVGSEAAAPELLLLEIANVYRDRNNRVTYRTTDGRYFKRSNSEKFTFKVGDICTLKKGAFSSIYLIREDGLKSKVKELSTS